MVGRGAHDLQRSGNIHTIGGEGLERCQALVVVHRQHCIVPLEGARSKETICRKGTKRQHAVLIHLLNGRGDNLLLLLAQESAIASVGVECQNRNAGCPNTKVLFERFVELVEALNDKLLAECLSHLRNGQVDSCQAHPHNIATHQHQGLATELLRQELRMSHCAKARLVHNILIHGSRNQHINSTSLHICHCPAERLHSHSATLCRGLANSDAHIGFATLHKVELAGACLRSRAYKVVVHALCLLNLRLVETHRLRCTIEHKGCHIVHSLVTENFNNRLSAHSRWVTKRNSYFYVFFHFVVAFL